MSSQTPRGSRIVFVDTSAFFGMLVRRDDNHLAAAQIQRTAAAQRSPFVSTNFVLAELHALMLAEVGRDIARRALLDLDRGSTLIVRAGEDDERRAREIIVRYRDKDFSLTDATASP